MNDQPHHLRIRRARSRLLLAAGLVCALAACGGGGNEQTTRESAAPPASATPSAGIDPCALVTEEEASEALGAAVRPSERPPEGNPRLATCRFVAPRGQGLEVLSVMVHAPDVSRIGFQTAKQQPFTSEAVPGIGDDAFWIGDPMNTLYVLKGNVFLSIGGDLQLDRARDLATRAVDRIE